MTILGAVSLQGMPALPGRVWEGLESGVPAFSRSKPPPPLYPSLYLALRRRNWG